MSMGFDAIRIYQLADSTLPTGGFVFSSGLESMARLGWLRNSADMYGYLDVQLEQACSAELPFINSVIAAFGLPAELTCIFDYYDAFIQVSEIRSASIRQARSWLDILAVIEPADSRLDSFIPQYKDTLHYTPVFALSLTELGISSSKIRELYIYMVMRDQISAAVRLGLTGPTKGAAILAGILEKAPEYIEKSISVDYLQAFRAAPMLEIAQAKHNELYTKLFQN